MQSTSLKSAEIFDVFCAPKVPPGRRESTWTGSVETRNRLLEAIRWFYLKNAHPPPVNFWRVPAPPVFATREKVEKPLKTTIPVEGTKSAFWGKNDLKTTKLPMQGGEVTCAHKKFHARVANEKRIGSKRDTKSVSFCSEVAKTTTILVEGTRKAIWV